MTAEPAAPPHVLLTGASGEMGHMLRPRLTRAGYALRLLDIDPPPGPGAYENVEAVTASVTDWDAIRTACEGIDAIVHLGGIATEAAWGDVLEANVEGTRYVLEAARLAGVPRVVLASSNHAAGFWTRAEAPPEGLAADVPPRPDTYYGFTKASMEALGSLYHSRFGTDVLCLRIGTCESKPPNTRALATWLSPDDAARLVGACLTAPEPEFRIVWGISANSRRWWSLSEGEQIGYRPVDDAEHFAAELIAEQGEPDIRDPAHWFLGGSFCTHELGKRHR